MVVTGSPYATKAAVTILEAGGNAVDAAAAACFALTVTDPAMASLGGRVQMVIALEDGRVVGVDGATEAPAHVPPLTEPEDKRDGYQLVPIPGLPAALAYAVERHGDLPLAQVLEPAIELAEDGFEVTRRVGEIWESLREQLAANPSAADFYLKPDGSSYRAGEIFRHPRLASLLRRMAESGPRTAAMSKRKTCRTTDRRRARSSGPRIGDIRLSRWGDTLGAIP
jgi:gamma-glutamyltranspeptidase/glutathione hydrolase